ncbi:MAG: hypothetical protein IMY79_03415 [Chloroflexi bacterium]|nr:hypothetical protein [Chloroflexota bacterium]
MPAAIITGLDRINPLWCRGANCTLSFGGFPIARNFITAQCKRKGIGGDYIDFLSRTAHAYLVARLTTSPTITASALPFSDSIADFRYCL